MVIVPVIGSAANPFEKSREMTKKMKKNRKSIELAIKPLTDRLNNSSLSSVLIKYSSPFTRARNNTAKPSARFRIFKSASRPYHCVAQ